MPADPDARLEEAPEPFEIPDDPDEPDDEPEAPAAGGGGPTHMPGVSEGPGGDREYQYRVEVVTLEEVLDGQTLPDRLSAASTDEWHLVDILDAGDRKAILYRKRRDNRPQRRPVGFSPSR